MHYARVAAIRGATLIPKRDWARFLGASGKTGAGNALGDLVGAPYTPNASMHVSVYCRRGAPPNKVLQLTADSMLLTYSYPFSLNGDRASQLKAVVRRLE